MSKCLNFGICSRIARCFLAITLFAQLSGPTAEAAPKQLTNLYSEGAGSDGLGNSVFWRISSTVKPLDDSQCSITRSQLPSLFLVNPTTEDDGPGACASENIFTYTYSIENTGTTPIKLAFPNRDVLRSPLIQTIQDFSVEIEPGTTKTVRFIAESVPKEIFSSVDVAIWDRYRKRWAFIRSGPVSLYLPSRPDLDIAPRTSKN